MNFLGVFTNHSFDLVIKFILISFVVDGQKHSLQGFVKDLYKRVMSNYKYE